jgi:predicted dehydrogenase
MISYERAEYAPAHSQSAWQIVGANGTLNLTMLYQDDKVLSFDEVTTADGLVVRELWRGTDRWEDMQDFITSDFLAAVADHREPQTPLDKALVLQTITDAVYESARTGTAVPVQ